MDTAIIPLGERSWQIILNHVVAVGDEAETSYLEVKSTIDLSVKAGVTKAAKFLLGAANRRPQEAAGHFNGYAVLIVGAKKDCAQGVLRSVEAHELEDRLRPYLGPQFPGFEFGRIPVDDEREVLFIIALPPKEGQTIFACHGDYHVNKRLDSLDDGAIYVRGASNTRKARSGEVLALVERARGGGKPPIDLDVEVLGSVSRVDRVDEVLEQLYQHEEERYIKPEVQAEKPTTTWASNVFGEVKLLSVEARTKRLEAWLQKKDAHVVQGREHLLGVALPGSGIRVTSHDRFVGKPHLIVTFHGCEVIDHRDGYDADLRKVVEPVAPQQKPFGGWFDPIDYPIAPGGYPVQWRNHGDDAEVVLTPESFRPNLSWESDRDDYVIRVRDPQASTVVVTWVLTEYDNDAVTRGDFEVPTGDLVDAADLITTTFSKDQ